MHALRSPTTPTLPFFLLLVFAASAVAQELPPPGERPPRQARRAEAPPPPPPPQAMHGHAPGMDAAPQAPPGPGPAPFVPPEPRTTHVVPIRHADAHEIARLVGAHYGQGEGFRVAAIARSNALAVSTPRGMDAAPLLELIAELDQPAVQAEAGPVIEPVVLKAADAERVADHLRMLLSPEGRQRGPVMVVADRQASAVWLSGPHGQVETAAAVARRMDELTIAAMGDGGQRDSAQLRFYPLRHAAAGPLSDTLNAIMQSMQERVRVLADAQSNTLIANANETQHARIAAVLERLDVQSRTPLRAPRTTDE